MMLFVMCSNCLHLESQYHYFFADDLADAFNYARITDGEIVPETAEPKPAPDDMPILFCHDIMTVEPVHVTQDTERPERYNLEDGSAVFIYPIKPRPETYDELERLADAWCYGELIRYEHHTEGVELSRKRAREIGADGLRDIHQYANPYFPDDTFYDVAYTEHQLPPNDYYYNPYIKKYVFATEFITVSDLNGGFLDDIGAGWDVERFQTLLNDAGVE